MYGVDKGRWQNHLATFLQSGCWAEFSETSPPPTPGAVPEAQGPTRVTKWWWWPLGWPDPEQVSTFKDNVADGAISCSEWSTFLSTHSEGWYKDLPGTAYWVPCGGGLAKTARAVGHHAYSWLLHNTDSCQTGKALRKISLPNIFSPHLCPKCLRFHKDALLLAANSTF